MCPDISKCEKEDCPLKECCYRYTSKSSPFWQSYAHFTYSDKTKSCEDFWCAEGKEADYEKIKKSLIAEPPLEESDINPMS
jgi:hypothetical protein